MTENQFTNSTILFADICHSTTLFENLGDEAAVALVMEALQLAGGIAEKNDGIVIGTIGDELMCTFSVPEDALITARQIHSQMRDHPLMLSNNLAMRIGMNSGPVVSASNSVYGDTVNIAARLAQQAKANQSLVSSATIEQVSENLRDELRLVGQIKMKGKADAIEVHELLETDSKEDITEVSGTKAVVQARSFLMSVRFRSKQMRFNPMLVRFLFGRGMHCDQIVDHPTISREHAEFLYQNGRFVFRDFSTNGSVIVHNQVIEPVHRSSLELKGEGKIYLGRTLHQLEFCIEYVCMDS